MPWSLAIFALLTASTLGGQTQSHTVTPNQTSSDGAAMPADPEGSPIFNALQQQLGLKLTRAKGPGEFLVIDPVERPSAN